MQTTRKDLTGQRFGLLRVIRYSHTESKRAYWVCLCDCGAECVKIGKRLLNGMTASCGCWRYLAKRKHGLTGTPIYIAWRAMTRRCLDPSDPDYPGYGGRGITVCERWQGDNGPINLLADKGHPPDGYTLERLDNDGNYEPGNVKWANRKEQARNRRNNKNLTMDGKTQSVAAWAEELDLSARVIRARLDNQWTAEAALTTPIDKRFSHPRH